MRKPDNTPRLRQKIAKPLTAEERAIFQDCSTIIRHGITQYIKVGDALNTILNGPLYREQYQSFEQCCNEEYQISRRAAYQFIRAAEVAQIVQQGEMIPPGNESQARKLVPLLHDPVHLMAAWKLAVEAHRVSGKPLTATGIQEAVRQTMQENLLGSLRSYLYPETNLPNIGYRWEVLESVTDPATGAKIKVPKRLPDIRKTPIEMPGRSGAKSPQSPCFVMVNPDDDIFPLPVAEALLPQLSAVMAWAIDYQFLIWSRNPEQQWEAYRWPANVEIAIQVGTREEFERLQVTECRIPNLTTLWLVPEKPFALPENLPYSRIIIGAYGWHPNDWSANETIAFRRMVATVMAGSAAVYQATSVQRLLGQTVKRPRLPISISVPRGTNITI